MSSFTMTTHQIWSCHVTLATNFENFYFSPNPILNFRKSYPIWGKLAQEQKGKGKKQNSGWKHPPVLIRSMSISMVQVIHQAKYYVT